MRRAQVQKFTERKIHKKLHYLSTVEGIISFKGTFVRIGVVRPREAYPELTNFGDKRFKNWGQYSFAGGCVSPFTNPTLSEQGLIDKSENHILTFFKTCFFSTIL